jgi:integrase/recombinase XerC
VAILYRDVTLFSTVQCIDNGDFQTMNNTLVSINSKISHLVPVERSTDFDLLLTDWLNTKRSSHTIRVYRNDIIHFLSHHDGLNLGKFLSCDRHQAFELVNRYKGNLIQMGLTAATINRRLAVVLQKLNLTL